MQHILLVGVLVLHVLLCEQHEVLYPRLELFDLIMLVASAVAQVAGWWPLVGRPWVWV